MTGLIEVNPFVVQANTIDYGMFAALDITISGLTLGVVGPGDDLTQVSADGVNDIATAPAGYRTALVTALASGRLSKHMLGKTSVWDDATERWLFFDIVDADNQFGIARSATNDRILFHLIAGGVSEAFIVDIGSPVTDMPLGIDINLTDSEFKGFYNGAPVGATQAIAGTWSAGAITSATVFAKAGPASVWSGQGGRLVTMDGLLDFASAASISP